MFCEKVNSSFHNSTALQVFFLQTNSTWCEAEGLYAYLPFHHAENFKDMYFKGKH